jgi:osmotically-inducible protein OsmY
VLLLATAAQPAAQPALALWPEAPQPPAPAASRPSWNAGEAAAVRLAQSRGLAGARIRVEGSGAELALRGVVRDEAQRQRALHIASGAAGGARVRDELAVDPALAAPAAVSDDRLARAVAHALAEEGALRARASEGWLFGWRVEGSDWAIDVEVDDGDVLLAGTAPLQQQIHGFILEARDVPGVRSVRSEITLRRNPEPADPVHSP